MILSVVQVILGIVCAVMLGRAVDESKTAYAIFYLLLALFNLFMGIGGLLA